MKTVLFWIVFGAGIWFTLCLARAGEPVMAAQTNSQISSTNTSTVAVPVPGEKAVRRYHATIAVGATAIIWSFLSPALFLFTGWSARIRSWAERRGHGLCKTGAKQRLCLPAGAHYPILVWLTSDTGGTD